jgi:effector-binding domain-containing protein
MYHTLGLTAACLLLCCLSLAAQTPAPAPATTQPADWQMGKMREQTVQGYTFCYLSTKASVQTITDAVGKLMPHLEKATHDGTIKPTGPVVFMYRGSAEDFTLEVGIMTAADAKAAGAFQVRTVPAFHCATGLYSGPLATIGEAYHKLMPEVFQKFQPTEQWREVYLYWEGPASPNNVVQVQIGIR